MTASPAKLPAPGNTYSSLTGLEILELKPSSLILLDVLSSRHQEIPASGRPSHQLGRRRRRPPDFLPNRLMPQYKNPVSVLVVIHTADLQVLLLERAATWLLAVRHRQPGGRRRPRRHGPPRSRRRNRVCLAAGSLPTGKPPTATKFPPMAPTLRPGVTHNTEHVFALACPPASPPPRPGRTPGLALAPLARGGGGLLLPGATGTPS